MNNDETGLTDFLAEICPISDDKKCSSDNFPLPDHHWINKPYKDHNYKTLLFLAIEKGNPGLTRILISAGAKAEAYNDTLGKCPIHVAIENQSSSQLKALLEQENNKANIDGLDQCGRTALHLAAEKGLMDLVQVLLDHEADVDLEDALGRRTPLYVAAINKDSEVVRLLLTYGASPLNTCFGKTVQEVIEEHMDYFDVSKVQVLKKARKNSMKEFGYGLNKRLDEAQMNLIKHQSNSQCLVQFKTLLSRFQGSDLDKLNVNGMTLMQKACAYGLDQFASLLLDQGASPNKIIEECGTPPLLFAAENGNTKLIQLFLEHKVSSIESTKTADFSVVERATQESVLHHILKIKKDPEETEKYEKCLNLILECEDTRVQKELLKVINHKDITHNVPLHYSTNLWPQRVTRKLLDRGANIGVKNVWDELPISKIMPETMKDFLDEKCLQSNGHPVTSADLKLTFDYSFLAPPIDEVHGEDLSDSDQQELIDKQALPETECLWYMGQSKIHRHLLTHPVVTSFLWLKWQKIRGYFNRNLRFYFLFVTTLTWYIFARYGGVSTRLSNQANQTLTEELNKNGFCSELSDRSYEMKGGFWYVVFCIQVGLQGLLMLRDWRRDLSQGCTSFTDFLRFLFITSWLDWTILAMMVVILTFGTAALWTVLTILLTMFAFREAFQMSVSLKRYIFTPENWLEGLLIILVGIILWVPDAQFEDPCQLKRHFAAISLVLSWAEMITLVARHPKLAQYNIYVTMFYKVLTTFTLFLAWYSFFIIAFALGFYIMLHKDYERKPEDIEDDEYKFFNHAWHSLVKTTIMFVGEIEFADLPIDLDSGLSFLFLLAFVFLIIVVLMNLLNGLAVSDTDQIRQQAEIVSHIARVDTISYTESILLGDPLDFLGNWPPFKWIANLPSMALMRCLFNNKTALHCLHKVSLDHSPGLF